MKILIYSPLFYPSIGGLEMAMTILAHEFVSQGHQVKVVTQTSATDSTVLPFEIIRYPALNQILALANWCDIYFQGCVSLKGILPAVMTRKPLAVTHQTWYLRTSGRPNWQDYLKQAVTRFTINIAASHAVAEHISGHSIVIPNSYRDELFYEIPAIVRDRELIFVGRLVSDKGADLLLQALSQLKQFRLKPKLTIVGTGPEEPQLRQQALNLGIAEQVEFVGAKVERELAQLLNAHRIMVVPSRWQEPFGIVALEGIACGCVVVGSEGGGLKDAIGPCGLTFPNGDVAALTHHLSHLLTHPNDLKQYRINAKNHLLGHCPREIATAYLQVFESAIC